MFDHYVAADWSQVNMAIARMTAKSTKIDVFERQTSLDDFKDYLATLKGKIILTIEECNTSQWLYTELSPLVEKLIICDPYRNSLLKEGPKNDSIDAAKLVQLLRNGQLKEVYHSGDELINLRKIVSGYIDVVKAGVRLKNQRAAILRSNGIKKSSHAYGENPSDLFVLDGTDRAIEQYEEERTRYEFKFNELKRTVPQVRYLTQIPGIGDILATKILSRVVDAKRFESKGKFLSYSGLVKHEKTSGGKSYGRSNTRYCRVMKSSLKTAALSAIRSDNEFKDYFNYLMNEKRYPEHIARHATCRRLAIVVWGVLKSNKPYRPVRKNYRIKYADS